MSGQVEIVKRESIPPSRGLERDSDVPIGGEFRDFRWSAELEKYLQRVSDLAISWVVLERHEVLTARVHSEQTLILIHGGSGAAIGDLSQPLESGDILVVPAGCRQGLLGGPTGLQALTIQLGHAGDASEAASIETGHSDPGLAALLAANEAHVAAFLQRPIFEMISDGTLALPGKRDAFWGALRIWREGQRAVLLARQAGCHSERFAPAFMQHLTTELGGGSRFDAHSQALCAGATIRDARLASFISWFAYQMYVLDDVEKTALAQLVLDRAEAALLGAIEQPTDRGGPDPAALELRARIGVGLLANQSPKCYARLQRLIGEAWGMMGALTDRVASIVRDA